MRRATRRVTAAGMMIAACAGFTLTGCSTAPQYRYIGSKDHDLVLRVPRGWSAVNTKDALKANGVDPASVSNWAVFYDASNHPDAKHSVAPTSDEPQLFAQSIAISSDERSGVTNDSMLTLMLPLTPDQVQAATSAGQFKMLMQKPISTAKQHGLHVIFSLKTTTAAASASEYYDRIALTDPKQTSVHVVYVHCDQQCFSQQHTQIEDAVTSLTLK